MNGCPGSMINHYDVLAARLPIGTNLKISKITETTSQEKFLGEIMNSTAITAIIGIAILTTSTLAFGATISTPLSFNLIGASDNVEVPAPSVNITSIDFIQEVAGNGVIETDAINFSVGNEDPLNSHSYEVCLVIEGPIGIFNPSAGGTPACTTTSSIPANGIITNQLISTTNATAISDLLNISVSVEELT
ncbi:MAG: hypothetical protein K5798_06700 [Nitrosopumilus sp.]|uniref:hypothetical protein n=1 Tax=Nitrosopumilus sp. TaxID=2024843 RepID=UPI00242D4A3D|nr:hypothetical protein [Nitrosopumilus sp.]MCV0366932.1 hypothetical protein [Nitrosopumilus sp.]